MHFVGVPETRASSYGRVCQAAQNHLLIRVLGAVVAQSVSVRAAAELRARQIVVRIQWVILEGEPVIAPDSVVPVLDDLGVAVAHDRTELRRQVPLVGQDTRSTGDVEGEVP